MKSLRMSFKAAVIVLVLLTIGVAGAFAEYNRDHVVRVMRENVSLMGEINQAATEEDWVRAAQKLFAISEGMVAIRDYDPPRGSKSDWAATMDKFIFAAYQGIGACGSMDSDGLQEAIGII